MPHYPCKTHVGYYSNETVESDVFALSKHFSRKEVNGLLPIVCHISRATQYTLLEVHIVGMISWILSHGYC